jgi:hypothetical protein
MALFAVAAIVRGIWREDDEAAVHREGLELDAKSRAFFVREGGADLGPALLGLAVSLVFLDGEDVEVGGRLIATGSSNGRIASGRRVGLARLTRRAGRVHGCTNGPAIGRYSGLGLIAIVHLRTPDLSD